MILTKNMDDREYLNRVLYKMKTDGTEKTKLSDNTGDINVIVVGDWIYYTKSRMFKFGNLDIFKMRIDGTKNTKVSNDSPYGFNVAGDWVIYHRYPFELAIYKVRTDGTEKTTLSNDSP